MILTPHELLRSIPLLRLLTGACLLLTACTPVSLPKPTDTPFSTLTSPPAPTAGPTLPAGDLAEARVSSLAWSPLGDHLAFTSSLGGVYLTGPNGEKAWPMYVVDNCAPCDPQIEWAPDGSRLLVTALGLGSTGQVGLWIVDLDGTAIALVEPTQSPYPLIAHWAPGSTSVAFLNQGEAWVYDLETAQARVVTSLGQNPIFESIAPYDRVSDLAWSPGGRALALEVTGNFPSPYAGILLLHLDSGALRVLANGGQSPGWSPEGDKVSFQIALGDYSMASTLDSYSVDVASGDIANLTRSNPTYDPFFQKDPALQPAPYQTGLVRWSPGGAYLYPTLTFPSDTPLEERGPERGFIVRAGPGAVLAEYPGSAESWYVYPTWLQDGGWAYLEARPPAGPAWDVQVVAAFIGDTQVWEGEDTIRAAAWTQDGSRLAIVLAGEDLTLFKQIQVLFPRLQQ